MSSHSKKERKENLKYIDDYAQDVFLRRIQKYELTEDSKIILWNG